MSYKILSFKPDSLVEGLRFVETKLPKKVQETIRNLVIVGDDIQRFNIEKQEKLQLYNNYIVDIDTRTNMPKIKQTNIYNNLSLRIEFVKGKKLHIGSERIFKFTPEDHDTFIDEKYETRLPDFKTIFLDKFTVFNYINRNPFPIKVEFVKLPQSISTDGPISFDVLINSNTIKENYKSEKKTTLVRGSKKKRDLTKDPIPLPIFDADLSYDEPSIYPVSKFITEKPNTFKPCQSLGDDHRSCYADSDCAQERYHLFNFYDFRIEISRLDGQKFIKQEQYGEISFTIDMKYYFMHYFSEKKPLTTEIPSTR